VSVTPRHQDELILSAIRMRCQDIGASDIASRLGTSSAYVRAATNRVKAADEAESGETVSDSYWDRPASGSDSWRDWGPLPHQRHITRSDPVFVSAKFGGRSRTRDLIGDRFGLGLTETELALSMARSAETEARAFAATFDETEDYQ